MSSNLVSRLIPPSTLAICFILELFSLPISLQPAAGNTQQFVQAQASHQGSKPHPSERGEPSAGFHSRVVHNGVALDLSINHVRDSHEDSLRAGNDVRITLGVHDAETGNPLTGLHPSAWMSLIQANLNVPCQTRVKSFLGGGLLGPRPEVDMNAYYVAALNHDASITITDPQFTSGKSRLVSLIQLNGPGEDWALSASQGHIYVAMPKANEVSMIGTADWKISRSIEITRPGRLALQPDEHYLWVGYGGEQPGVAVLNAASLSLAKRIALGEGPHDIAFSSDNRFAFVTNQGAGSVTVIDVPSLAKIKELKIGGRPLHIAFSAIAQSAYVADGEKGVIFSINRQGTVSPIHAESGLTRISFPGDGRLGFVLNPDKGKVYILDVARNEIVQTADIDKMPTQISFSNQLAYVVRQASDLIEMLPLDQLGKPDTAVPVVDLPGPKNSNASNLQRDEFTTSVVQVPGANAVVIASPSDKAVYYYDEGMAAPMGIFRNFGKEPGAVQVIDRSLREGAPGIYETSVRLDKSGVYSLPVAITSPPLVECFQVPVGQPKTASSQ